MWILLFVFLMMLSVIVTIKIRFDNYKLINIINSFKGNKTSLFMSLGTKIGVGSIIGTASSIVIGGYSSVIWMLIFSFITSSLIYIEAYYGKKYRIKKDNEYFSGSFYIIKNGLNNKTLAYISLVLLIIIYSFFFQMIQSNTISNILYINMGINKNIVCISFIIILLITISFKIKDIINVMMKLVPLMCILFILLSTYGVVSNIDELFVNISNINLFSAKSIATGMIIGIKRSLFMNETLIGTTSISSGIDNNSIKNSSSLQVLSSYFISFIITILVASLLIIYNNNAFDYNSLLSNTYLYTTNELGLFILIIIIILFGITTLLSGYYIGKSNILSLSNNKIYLYVFNLLFSLSTISGIYFNNYYIWKYLDSLMFIMILINSYSIIKLLGSDNNDRKRLG